MFLLGRPSGHCQDGLSFKVRGGQAPRYELRSEVRFLKVRGGQAPALRITERLLFLLCRVEHPDKVQDIHRAIAIHIGTRFGRRRFAEVLNDTREV